VASSGKQEDNVLDEAKYQQVRVHLWTGLFCGLAYRIAGGGQTTERGQ
jgi:hypothetical protein